MVGRVLLPLLVALAVGYALLLLWLAAGLVAVLALAGLLNAGLALARQGDRPLEDWPILRRLRR